VGHHIKISSYFKIKSLGSNQNPLRQFLYSKTCDGRSGLFSLGCICSLQRGYQTLGPALGGRSLKKNDYNLSKSLQVSPNWIVLTSYFIPAIAFRINNLIILARPLAKFVPTRPRRPFPAGGIRLRKYYETGC
jgi:hypothetical protein